MKSWLKFKISVTPWVLSLCLSALYFFGMNAGLIARLHGISQTETMKPGFILSLPVFFIAAFNILFLPFCNRHTAKPVFIILTLLSAPLGYATFNYGVIFSMEMIVNIVTTNIAEASSYLNLPAILWIFSLGVLPAVVISRLLIVPSKRQYAYPAYALLASVLAIVAVGALYSQEYIMTSRNYSDLKRIVVPTYAISSTYKLAVQRFFTEKLPYRQIGIDAHQADAVQGKKSLTVLIVGETARAANYQLNGYARETNKFTKPQGVGFYNNVTSCGTETAVSVPCMFSNLTRAGYSFEKAESQDNALDVLKRAKVQLLWLDNDSGCKGACKNVETVDIRKAYADDPAYCDSAGCLDAAFIPELEKQLPKMKDENTVIVLHLMGSHGPAYYKRYPNDFDGFKPDCRQSDVQNCPPDALVNTYDNTILYTDYVISRVIDVLQKNEKRWDMSLLYLSDHGESLGENGIYLHGLPYRFAPKEQKHIPLITWFSAGYLEKNKLETKCLQDSAGNEYSQDNVFHTLLGLADVSTAAYNDKLDIFHLCRK